jgi:hypothetical protein
VTFADAVPPGVAVATTVPGVETGVTVAGEPAGVTVAGDETGVTVAGAAEVTDAASSEIGVTLAGVETGVTVAPACARAGPPAATTDVDVLLKNRTASSPRTTRPDHIEFRYYQAMYMTRTRA